jgi:hypothetical protein
VPSVQALVRCEAGVLQHWRCVHSERRVALFRSGGNEESTIIDPENRNVGKPWSAMDLFDLKNSLAYGSWVKEIAEFLMRREIEVREKMLELGLKERRKLT